jgi:membrane-bound lytic murein transglycosylase D
MDLRAFKYKSKKRHLFIALISVVFFVEANGQSLPKGEVAIPYQIKFADVTFQFNDVSRYLLAQEVGSLSKNEEQINEYLKKFSLIYPTIKPILEKANVPEDFKFLSLYNRYQKSLNAAMPLDPNVFWVMEREKAADVDLRINNEVDETKHLILATKGALVCIKRNQVLYQNWATTLFAHIASRDVIKLLEVNKKWSGKFVVIDSPAYSSLIQFLAFRLVLENAFAHYKNPNPDIIYEYAFGKGKSLNLIAADLKLEPSELLSFNQWLKTNKVPDSEAQVLVVTKASRYHEIRMLSELSRNMGLSNVDLGFPIVKPNPQLNKGKGGVFYLINNLKGIQIEMCDNAVNAAYKADISLSKFLEYNEMKEADILNVGEVYYIESKKSKADIPHHIVRNQETLWDIAQMYGVKLKYLLKYNRMETLTRLQPGRVIWLQTKRPKKKPIEIIEIPEQKEIKMPDMPRFQDDFITRHEASDEELEQEYKTEGLKTEPEVFNSGVLNKNENVLVIAPRENIVVPKEVTPKPKTVKKEVKVEVIPEEQTYAQNLKEVVNASTGSEPKYVVHEVKKGETLYRISVNYRVSVDQLYRLNNLKNNIIEIGDKIIVKKY